jgi:hypothetical protein
MAVAQNSNGLKNLRGADDSDQHDPGRSRGYGRRRVHHDA